MTVEKLTEILDKNKKWLRNEVRGVGKWLEHPIDDDWKICSVCGVGSRFRYTLFDGETKIPFSVTEPSRYCKNCGARMIEVIEDD